MKLYVANITQSEKMVYLSCLRYVKENGKYIAVSFPVSLKKDKFNSAFGGKKIPFPFIIEAEFKKGSQPDIKLYGEKV